MGVYPNVRVWTLDQLKLLHEIQNLQLSLSQWLMRTHTGAQQAESCRVCASVALHRTCSSAPRRQWRVPTRCRERRAMRVMLAPKCLSRVLNCRGRIWPMLPSVMGSTKLSKSPASASRALHVTACHTTSSHRMSASHIGLQHMLIPTVSVTSMESPA